MSHKKDTLLVWVDICNMIISLFTCNFFLTLFCCICFIMADLSMISVRLSNNSYSTHAVKLTISLSLYIYLNAKETLQLVK